MRDVVSRTWRPVGVCGMTAFVCLGPFLVWHSGNDAGPLVSAYGLNLAAWVAAAGIRQWGKQNGSEG